MDLNKWEAFLSDQKLASSPKYQWRHDGEYLFGKISHDALACLNNYLAVLSLMNSQDVKIGDDTLARFEAKKGVVETAVTEICSLLEQTEGLPETSRYWPSDIKMLGSKLRKVQNFADELRDVDESAISIENELAKIAIANLRGLQAIYNDIEAENYKQMLTTST
ncbi:MAG: hypothetical protein WAS33_22505 [Candidatus Promineifilaceae bacterium]